MRRLVVLAVAAGVLLLALPASAEVERGEQAAGAAREREALAVLARAVRASSDVDYRGTQYVATGHAAAERAALVEVSHRPGAPAVVSAAGGRQQRADAAAVPATAMLDARRVQLLAAAYDLAVSGHGRCTDRDAVVVEARRDDGQLAGRFWVDDRSGLLLRRAVHDATGRRVRDSAFVELDVRSAAVPVARRARGEPVASAAALRTAGWHVPRSLPGGFGVLDAELSSSGEQGDVVHLAYSDGLSSTSLFVQRGELGSAPPEGFRADAVDGRPVWVSDGSLAQVVWSGSGQVWTMVSDAPADQVRAAVASLPRDPAPDEGLRARLVRGLHRLLGALVPGD